MMVVIWVDGDSCPVPVRNLLIRTALKRNVTVRFCANRELPLEVDRSSPDGISHVEMRVVTDGTVDTYILNAVGSVERGALPLVVTRDIPLAEELVDRGVAVMNDRGRLFEADAIRELRSLRDARATIREQGLESMSSGRTYGAREQKAFADTLDRFLTRAYRNG